MKIMSLLLLFISLSVWAQENDASEIFTELITQYNIGPSKEQSFCYHDGTQIIGARQNEQQRIASVTKLFTTLLASENLDLKRQFITNFFVTKDWLHIEGGEDPYFEEEKLLLLFKELNDLGYRHFKRVTFTKKFHFYDLALGTYINITPGHTLKRLQYYFNKKNQHFLKEKWEKVRNFAEEEGIQLSLKVPMITAGEVGIKNNPPNQGNEIFIHESKPLYALIKTMNVQSKNYVSENIYKMASQVKSMHKLLEERGISPKTFHIKNGSGLPIIIGAKRHDNMASCETVLRVIQLLLESIQKQQLVLSEVMAVNGGVDFGSLRDRFKEFPETFQSVLAKTGTLKNTSSLAGILLAQQEKPFAILNHTIKTVAARHFQDHFVAKLFDLIGAKNPLIYQKISIFPWDEKSFFTHGN
jgi:D-alanyl-D-alanine carboxypeptidase